MLRLSPLPALPFSFSPAAETFLVEEISEDGTVLELGKKIEKTSSSQGKFSHFILEKKNWATINAELALAKALHITPKRFSHAGAKDRNATTAQLCSAFAVEPERLLSLHIKDISINGAWKAGDAIRMGALQGNRFTAIVPEAAAKAGQVNQILKSNSSLFPNYFGSQRFGSLRENTHEIGKLVMQGNFGQAVLSYLAQTSLERNQEAVNARKELASTQDFSLALKNFPGHLKYERLMLSHLSTHPKDFLGAFQRLPRSLSLMFMHAYQSCLFNQMLEERVNETDFTKKEGEYFCQKNKFGFPEAELKEPSPSKSSFLVSKLLGYETKPEDLSELEKEILEKEQISLESFKIKKFPGLSVKGACRCALAPLVSFSFEDQTGTFRFSLQKGAYATVALREFLGSA